MKNSDSQFAKGLDKAFSNIPLNNMTMGDAAKLKSSLGEENKLKGGKADKRTLKDVAKKHTPPKGDFYTRMYYVNAKEEELKSQLKKGIKVEMEHTKDEDKAREIALDHLWEDPKYYQKLKKIEGNEQIIRRPFKSGVSDKLVGKQKMDKPIGKIFAISKNETKEDDSKVTAKAQFASDLQKDPDFQEFKKNAKYKKGGSEFTFGVPNVSHEDPYIKKKTKYGRPGRGKEETVEATGTGSSGAYSAPLFGGDNSEFIKKSNAETPKKLKEGLATGAMGLDKVEAKEATGTGSVGAYSTPAMWAKSTKKKDWGPSRKAQIPGGKFVSVKKKCTKFPYCNQGDINALHIWESEPFKEAIKKVSSKMNISENVIMAILDYEFEKVLNG